MSAPAERHPFPHHVWCLAVAPALLLYAENAAQLAPSQLLLPFAAALAVAALFAGAARVATGTATGAALLASAALAVFWSRGHLALATAGWVAGEETRLAVGLFSLLLLAVLAARLRTGLPGPRVSRFLNAFAGLLVALPVARVALATLTVVAPPAAERDAVRLPRPPGSGRLPDVVLVVLDAFASPRLLASRYDLDLGPFRRALTERGFFVADDVRSNYALTEFSLASLLNHDHVDALVGPRPRGDRDRAPIRVAIDGGRVLSAFRAAGYRIVTFPSGYSSAEVSTADEIRRPVFAPSEFHALLLQTSALPELLRVAGFAGDDLAYDLHRARALHTLGSFPSAAGRARPSFILAHALVPHPPFVLDRDGAATRSPWPFTLWDGSELFRRFPSARASYVASYREQALGTSRLLLAALDELLAKTRGEVVVLVVGDHGPRLGTDLASSRRTDLDEAFSSFLAAYWPSRNYESLRAVRSLVNVFPALFEGAFGVRVPFRPDRSFFAPYEDPYAFEDVTASLALATERSQ